MTTNAYRFEIYVRNEKSLAIMINSIASTIAKKMKKGVTIDKNRLASSYVVRNIVSQGAKIVAKYDDVVLTREERKECKEIAVREIMDRAEEKIWNNEI